MDPDALKTVYRRKTDGDAHMTGFGTSSVTPRIAVVGVGGAGCNVVSSFYDSLCPVDTIAVNTDKDAMHRTNADQKIYICKEVLRGEGAHGDAEVGKKCADIHREEIRQAVSGYDFVFVVAGLGGGTGTGAASVVIDAARSQNITTFAIAISPFSFEGRRKEVAREGYRNIKAVCEHSILVDNDLVLSRMSDLTMDKAFAEVNGSIRRYVMDSVARMEKVIRDEMSRSVPVAMEEPAKAGDTSAYPIETLISA